MVFGALLATHTATCSLQPLTLTAEGFLLSPSLVNAMEPSLVMI